MDTIITLDVGNTQIYGGVFEGEDLKFTFRKHTKQNASSDEYGLFLKLVLKENNISPEIIKAIIISSVVPEINHSLSSACIKYFKIKPLMLQAGLKTGLNLKVKNPAEVGADRVANAVAAVHQFPNKNIALVDLGTATTICVINQKSEWLGGLIVPGLKLSMLTLEQNTSKLPAVEIIKPSLNSLIGKTTVENIQLGLYYSAYGLIKTYIQDLKEQYFKDQKLLVIGTGGFSSLFKETDLFDHIFSDLVLQGLREVWCRNG